ncbi:hypothetical protein KY285_030176 [Solanum tuberosum]|nr:hypothetical protein KY285_030176 [Solanum tuberosum]
MHRLTMARTLVTKFAGLPRNPAIMRGTILTKQSVRVMDVDEDLAGNVTYVDVDDTKISEKSVVTMVDTRETHTFRTLKIVKEYGLKVTNCATKMKVVNFAARPCYVMALEVPLTVGH